MTELTPGANLPFRIFAEGAAHAEAVVSAQPISFAGDFDAATGIVVGRHSALRGECLTGRILVYPYGRGSSSTSSILAEALRRGTAPAAIVNVSVEHIIVVAALVAGKLFDTSLPIIAVAPDLLAALRTGDRLEIDTAHSIFRLHARAGETPSAAVPQADVRGPAGNKERSR